MIDKQTAKEIALACGFKLKLQANGEMDLNAYVYEAFNKVAEHCWSAFKSGVMPHKIHPTKASLNNGWISVKDELPSDEDWVLATSGTEIEIVGISVSNDGEIIWIRQSDFYPSSNLISHWQPLPEPPKE